MSVTIQGQARRPRVTILAPSFPRLPGGGARTYYEHANGLARRGYDVTVVHSLNYRTGLVHGVADRLRERARYLKAGLIRRRVSWMQIDSRVRLAYVPRLSPDAKLPPADIRVGTFWRTTEFLGTLRDDSTACAQLIQAYEVWAGPVDRVNAAWLLPFPAAVVSSELREKALAMGVPPQRLHLVFNGLDHDTFRVTNPPAARKPVLTFLAHPAPVKGLSTAIAVSERVHAEAPHTEIIAFGSGPRPGEMPDYVSYYRRPVGSELVEIYNRTAVFLCPSDSEGWGFPSIEAMACGAALVSTRNGGVNDFAVDGNSAILCDVGDVAALSGAVLALLGDPDRRIALAAAGAASASRFTWEASSDSFAAMIADAMPGQ